MTKSTKKHAHVFDGEKVWHDHDYLRPWPGSALTAWRH